MTQSFREQTAARRVPLPAPAGARAIAMIVGPTASGKSALALEVAERLDAEIISADSQQVYRGFDLGTAKPTPAELGRVPHHLISIVDPDAEMNAATYARLAAAAIEDVARRGRLPLVVGGTGLYARALLFGVVPLPPTDPGVRARLQTELREGGVEPLRARLRAVDPAAADAIASSDRLRLLRALEVHASTGEPVSALRARHGFRQFRYRAVVLGLSPPREELYRRIDARTRGMFDAGLVEEVQALIDAGHEHAAPMRAIGYRQALAYLRQELDRERAIELACRDTRNYGKRQLTWFRAEPWVRWLNWPPAPDGVAAQLREASTAITGAPAVPDV